MNAPERQVLVIDGDEESRDGIVGILRAAGIESIDSEDGFEAVGRIEAGSYRAILLDVRESPSRVDRTVPMGFGVLDHLHRNKPEMLRRVIVMTKNPPLFISSPWYERVAGFVIKPVDSPALLSALQEHLRDGA